MPGRSQMSTGNRQRNGCPLTPPFLGGARQRKQKNLKPSGGPGGRAYGEGSRSAFLGG